MNACCDGKTKIGNALWKIVITVSFLLGAVLYVRDSRSEPNRSPAKVKLPHQHGPAHGGLVVMFGDDHLELINKSPGVLKVFISDKFREPVPVALFNIKAVVISADQRSELKPRVSEKEPNAFFLDLPKPIPDGAKLELRIPRVTPVKGQVTTDNPQIVDLDKFLKPGAQNDMSGHDMSM